MANVTGISGQERNTFPGCPSCPLLEAGAPHVCLACVLSVTDDPLDPCPTCARDMILGQCDKNPVCRWDSRYYDCVWAIAKRENQWNSALKRYKYEDLAWIPPISPRRGDPRCCTGSRPRPREPGSEE